MRERLLLLAVVWLATLGRAEATIHYSVSVMGREDHLFRVTMVVPDAADPGGLVVALPAWNALYQVRDFAHRVRELRAFAAPAAPAPGASLAPLPVTKLDKQTWRVHGTGRVVLQYKVLWDEPGAFSSQLNADHAFVNLATILLYVPARRAEDAAIEFTHLAAGWRAAVALARTEAPLGGMPLPAGEAEPAANLTTGWYAAANYDALVDAPAELGSFEESRLDFTGPVRPFAVRIVTHGAVADRAALEDTLRRIVAYQVGLMRDVPFAEFLFLYHFGQGGGGGMEHANSTAIHLGSSQGAAGISAHEFFHLWNVKRIRPRSLEPVDYAREQWTRALWFAEGVTNTYGEFTLVRTGLVSPQQFYDSLAGATTQLQSRPARLWKSVEEASLDAWLEKYGLHNRPDQSISYYNKGQVLGVLLDILIRDATDNRSSLDDVLRDLNEEYARRGRFYDDSAGIRAAVERRAGRSFAEFFARYVAGTDELPMAETLALAGLTLRPAARVQIEENPAATEKQRRIRAGLLRGTTD